MNKKTVILFAVLFSLGAGLTALAQTQSPSGPPSSGPVPSGPPSGGPPEIQPSSTVDGQGAKRYRVGPGDILDVRVFGQSELNSTVEVDEDGNISSLPFLEDPLPARCRNEKEIQKIITLAYSKYLRKPRVSVRVLDRKSRPPAVVFGAVRQPTRVQMMRRVRLHELLVAAGGITQGASGTIQIIHTGPEMCPQDVEDIQQIAASFHGEAASRSAWDKVAEGSVSEKAAASFSSEKGVSSPASDKKVDASVSQKGAADSDSEKAESDFDKTDPSLSDIGKIQIYQTGDVRTGLFKDDPSIRPGDIVIVTEGEPIYVTGGVLAAASLVMKDGMTLGRAIAMSGGLQRMAKSHEIHIYRLKKGKVGFEDLTFDYDAIRHGKQPDVLLQAYDIIDVRMYGQFHPRNLADYFLNITKGSVGGITSTLQYRILY